MLHNIHQKLGTAGFIISIIALIAALGGGAYAASGGLRGKQKKEVEKIAKKYAGQPGAAGATGPAGPGGAKGDAGANGTNGTNGTNGAPGAPGETGFSEVLPSEATETGTFLVPEVITSGLVFTNISFNIPLASELDINHAIFVRPGEVVPVECENVEHAGQASALNPEAKPGYLCVFAGQFNGIRPPAGGEEPEERPVQILNVDHSHLGASQTGAFIQMEPSSATQVVFVNGSWAVAGE